MAEYIKLSELEKAVFVKQEEEKQYWFNWLKQFRATKEYPIKETAVDNYLRGYGEAVAFMLSVNEQLLLKSADVVKVVKCKNCVFSKHIEDSGNYKCTSFNGRFGIVKAEDFCSYGERRSNE